MSKRCLCCGGPIQSRGPKRDAVVKFCSRTCRFDQQRTESAANGTGRLTKACEICNTDFTYYRSVRPLAAYCSMSCRAVGQARKMTGRMQDAYGRNATFRKAIRLKFIDRCAICGWDEAPTDVAHIVSRREGGEDAFENVVMLCPNHHRLYDTGRIPIQVIRAARVNCLPA